MPRTLSPSHLTPMKVATAAPEANTTSECAAALLPIDAVSCAGN
jgi:hypothetical protein